MDRAARRRLWKPVRRWLPGSRSAARRWRCPGGLGWVSGWRRPTGTPRGFRRRHPGVEAAGMRSGDRSQGASSNRQRVRESHQAGTPGKCRRTGASRSEYPGREAGEPTSGRAVLPAAPRAIYWLGGQVGPGPVDPSGLRSNPCDQPARTIARPAPSRRGERRQVPADMTTSAPSRTAPQEAVRYHRSGDVGPKLHRVDLMKHDAVAGNRSPRAF